jgi:hypothetical protein
MGVSNYVNGAHATGTATGQSGDPPCQENRQRRRGRNLGLEIKVIVFQLLAGCLPWLGRSAACQSAAITPTAGCPAVSTSIGRQSFGE